MLFFITERHAPSVNHEAVDWTTTHMVLKTFRTMGADALGKRIVDWFITYSGVRNVFLLFLFIMIYNLIRVKIQIKCYLDASCIFENWIIDNMTKTLHGKHHLSGVKERTSLPHALLQTPAFLIHLSSYTISQNVASPCRRPTLRILHSEYLENKTNMKMSTIWKIHWVFFKVSHVIVNAHLLTRSQCNMQIQHLNIESGFVITSSCIYIS